MNEINKPGGYDIIGHIAIVELKPGADEKAVAEQIMKDNKNVRTVAKKITARSGTYRLRKLQIIAGDAELETTHKEHGMSYRLNPDKTYFSPREGEERQHIAEKIGDNETVLVMFAGMGAFAIAIAKKKPTTKTYAVEINEDAYNYMRTNIRLNRVDALVYPLKGDVRNVCKNLDGRFDRVVMPLPSGAHEFLDIAIRCLKKNGWIHFYTISKEGEEDYAKETLIQKTKKLGREARDVISRKVLPYAPRIWKRCVEAKIE